MYASVFIIETNRTYFGTINVRRREECGGASKMMIYQRLGAGHDLTVWIDGAYKGKPHEVRKSSEHKAEEVNGTKAMNLKDKLC